VLIETYTPGTMDEWGLGYEHLKDLNPRLIFASSRLLSPIIFDLSIFYRFSLDKR
jgi:hypothetical protein